MNGLWMNVKLSEKSGLVVLQFGTCGIRLAMLRLTTTANGSGTTSMFVVISFQF